MSKTLHEKGRILAGACLYSTASEAVIGQLKFIVIGVFFWGEGGLLLVDGLFILVSLLNLFIRYL